MFQTANRKVRLSKRKVSIYCFKYQKYTRIPYTGEKRARKKKIGN